MAKKLQTAYAHKKKAHELIYVPRQDMICAVNLDGVWYRGRLNGPASSARDFHVWLVDVGTIETVHWDCIRHIDEQFRELPEAVACCYLAHVTPSNGLWSPDALVVFKRSTKNTLRIQADVVDGKCGYQAVVLYEMPSNQSRICINEMLVSKGFAVGDDLLSSRPTLDPDTPSDDSDSRMDNIPSFSLSKNSTIIDTKNRVKIQHIVSPGEFYITLARNISAVDQLHFLIQKHMLTNAKRAPVQNWKVGDLCLAKTTLVGDPLDLIWYRGRIVSIGNNKDSCSVFIRDRGHVVSIGYRWLIQIPEIFKSIEDAAMRCHMVGVQPTNGVAEWSATSIDVFRKLVDDFEGICRFLYF